MSPHLQVIPIIMAYFIGIDTIIALEYFRDQNYNGMILPVISAALLLFSMIGMNIWYNGDL